MKTKCKCIENIKEKNVVSSSPKNILIDFGKLPLLHKRCKDVTIDLEDNHVHDCRLEKSQKINFHDDIFTLAPVVNKTGDKENKIKLKCSYKPQTPFIKSAEIFNFISPKSNLTITIRGESTGPIISVSDNHIKFFLTSKEKNGKQVFLLKNVNKIPTEFIVDMDTQQKLFSITPTHGVIKKDTYIWVTFSPKEYGTYYQQIIFLIFGSEPLVVSLFGSYTKDKVDQEKTCYINYPFPLEDTLNYTAYFKDVSQEHKAEKKTLPVYLNTISLDFGTVAVKQNSLIPGNVNDIPVDSSIEMLPVWTKNFSVTNDTNHEVFVNWIEDDNIFKIMPRKTSIPPGTSMFFKCFFTPPEKDAVYFRKFTAQVDWLCDYVINDPSDTNTIIIPLNVSITVQGIVWHSLMPLTNLELRPRHLLFAPSLVGTISYQNMLVYNRFSRSVIFKLVAPVKSRITMKPMTGIIKDFVIISARFRANKKPKPLMEVWNLIVNGEDEKPISFCVQGLSELPTVEIGDNNELILSTAQVGTVYKEDFMLKNKCCLNLSYSFVPPVDKVVSIVPDVGEVLPYEEVPITVVYQAKVCAPRAVNMFCKLYVKHKLDAVVGQNYDHSFVVHCNTAYTQLCATPAFKNFDFVEFGNIIENEFHVFNFGQTVVSFILHVNSMQSNIDKITVVPTSGDLLPGKGLQINLKIECLTLGDNNCNIEYSHANSLEENASSNIFLFAMTYHTALGKIQVAEIVEHNFGPLFTKLHFWEYLQIDRLNEQLIKVEPTQSDFVNIKMPECVIGSKHYLRLLIENPTQFDTELIFKRKKVCDCEPKPTLVTFNSTKRIYDCPHREVLVVEETNAIVTKNSSIRITIKVSYNLPGETKMAYDIHLRHNRLFTLYIYIYGTSIDECRVSTYNTDLRVAFKPIHLSTRVQPTQFFWFYNNSPLPSTVAVDTSKLKGIYQRLIYDVFECPQNKGEISPYGVFALKFKFCPIELRNYTVKIPLWLNEDEKLLTLEGSGTLENSLEDEYFRISMPQLCSSRGSFPVVFSVDYVVINCLPIYNYTERIIFIQNVSTNTIMYYEWNCVDIPNFIKISALDEIGYLLPSQTATIKLRVESFHHPLISDFVLSCRLIDLQQLYPTKKIEDIEQELTSMMQCKMDDVKQEQFGTDTLAYTVALTIRVNIVHTRDLTKFVKPADIFTYYPRNELQIDITTHCLHNQLEKVRKFFENDNLHKNLTEYVLRLIISDVVFEDSLKEILEGLKDETFVYYSQLHLNTNVSQSINETERLKQYFSTPSILADTIKTFIYDTILKTFVLSRTIKNGKQQNAHKELEGNDFANHETKEEINKIACLEEKFVIESGEPEC